MKVKLLILFLLVFTAIDASAQYENVWIYGFYPFDRLDFNSSPPAFSYINLSGGGNNDGESSASVCDNSGQLLFFTDGSYAWDRNYNCMNNGNGLTGLVGDVASSSSQGALIVPMPDQPNKYYVFSMTSNENGDNWGRLYYSIVDMSLNGGMGDVVSGSTGILLDSLLTEQVTGVVGDRCNVWVIALSRVAREIKSYEITSSGINTTPVISSVPGSSAGLMITGHMDISPNRKKILIASGASPSGCAELYDFNGATGILSNLFQLDLTYGSYYGACFSPDNTKVYISTDDIWDYVGHIYQYDISLPTPAAITASKIDIGECATTGLKRGPDGKIYFETWVYDGITGEFIGRIDNPNAAGTACQYEIDSNLHHNGDFGGFPNAVPVFHRDTVYTTQPAKAPCFAPSFSINALNDTDGWDYTWNTGALGPGLHIDSAATYWVTYHTPPCVYHADTFHTSFLSLPPTIGTLSGCPGKQQGKAWILPATSDTTTYTYRWGNFADSLLQPATTSSIIADTLYNQPPGTYMVALHGSNGCDTTIDVAIAPPSDTGFLHASDTGICPHDTINIYVTGGVSYHWRPDDKTYISDTSVANPKVCPPTDWGYIVYGANASGCLDTTTAHVRVFSNAVIQLPDSVILYYGESYQFNPGTNCLNFSWFPPLGLNADNISNPIASPPVDTKYIVTGTTEEGCTIKDSVNVYRNSDVVLTLPNAFTPGNGPNSLLKPIHEGNVVLDYLRVFNRWGQMVYESSDLNAGWDGTWHGSPQTESVYIYTMQGHTATGKILSKQGNITLLR